CGTRGSGCATSPWWSSASARHRSRARSTTSPAPAGPCAACTARRTRTGGCAPTSSARACPPTC
ncbi:MAG: hypothetical protein AVDCRST_MAG54-1824, partial [uncultured Actinomycetospora sp.]